MNKAEKIFDVVFTLQNYIKHYGTQLSENFLNDKLAILISKEEDKDLVKLFKSYFEHKEEALITLHGGKLMGINILVVP